MELNCWEMLAMNNPLRRFLLKEIEFRLFKKLIEQSNISIQNSVILDVASGSAYSSSLINSTFCPKKLVSFDLMPSQLKLAQDSNYCKNLFLGDVESLSIKPASFDWVFGFGFLHHLGDWRRGLSELSRVLKPGGCIILEEPNGKASQFFHRYIGFAIPREGQFTFIELKNEFQKQGFELRGESKILLSCFRTFIFQKKG